MSPDAAATTTPGEDTELMRRVQMGDEAALGALMQRWELSLKAFIGRIVLNTSEAEELAQETFVRVWQQRGRYRADAPFRPWIFAIAVNLARNRLRWWKLRPLIALEDWTEVPSDSGTAAGEKRDGWIAPSVPAPCAMPSRGCQPTCARRSCSSNTSKCLTPRSPKPSVLHPRPWRTESRVRGKSCASHSSRGSSVGRSLLPYERSDEGEAPARKGEAARTADRKVTPADTSAGDGATLARLSASIRAGVAQITNRHPVNPARTLPCPIRSPCFPRPMAIAAASSTVGR